MINQGDGVNLDAKSDPSWEISRNPLTDPELGLDVGIERGTFRAGRGAILFDADRLRPGFGTLNYVACSTITGGGYEFRGDSPVSGRKWMCVKTNQLRFAAIELQESDIVRDGDGTLRGMSFKITVWEKI